MHTFVARFLEMCVWMWVIDSHPYSHPHPQEPSNKGMHSIELVEFYLGILFSAFGINCGESRNDVPKMFDFLLLIF